VIPETAGTSIYRDGLGLLGRIQQVLAAPKGPGLFFVIPLVDRMVKVNQQTVTLDIPPHDVITKDNVTSRVNAVTYMFSTSQIELGDLRLVTRDSINQQPRQVIDELTDPWGIKVTLVEVKGSMAERNNAAVAGT